MRKKKGGKSELILLTTESNVFLFFNSMLFLIYHFIIYSCILLPLDWDLAFDQNQTQKYFEPMAIFFSTFSKNPSLNKNEYLTPIFVITKGVPVNKVKKMLI